MSKEGKQSVATSTRMEKSGFAGRFDRPLDPKKRFTIPSEWRNLMGDPEFVYVMPDPKERCLNIIPQAEMEGRLAELRKNALFGPAQNRLLQIIGANSEMPALDVQGRIRISDKLLQFANLKTTVAMQGAVLMIQLWDPSVLSPAEKVDQEGLGEALAMAGF